MRLFCFAAAKKGWVRGAQKCRRRRTDNVAVWRGDPAKHNPPTTMSELEESNARDLARCALERRSPPRHRDYLEALMRVESTVPICLWPVHMVDWITGDGTLNYQQRWQCFLFACGNFPGDSERKVRDLYALVEHKINPDARQNMLTHMPNHARRKQHELTYHDVIDKTTRTLSGHLVLPETSAQARADTKARHEMEVYSKCFDENASMPSDDDARMVFSAT